MRTVFSVAILLLLNACAAPQYRQISINHEELPPAAEVKGVPFYAQEDHYCGPASMAMMMNHSGYKVTQDEMAKLIYTPDREGTLPGDVLAGARRNGVLAVKVDSLNDMLKEVAAGHPVMIFQNLGLSFYPKWHYAVVKGFDLNNEQLILHSGLVENKVTNINTFEKTWARADYWAVTMTQADKLPASANAINVMEGASGLERVQRYDDAIKAYKAMLTKWSDNLSAAMGLGNSYYAKQHYKSAVKAYRQAILIEPEYSPAWNNLAYALDKRGDKKASIAAAKQAIKFAGEDTATYQETLAELTAH